ncbi:hypothetical protein V492_03294 [Pseudogymnoascus sp. VKM F-4246]|nr:hypothetical protein V492_03294 [Pseudogymnoascus sp. VKM F-4246]
MALFPWNISQSTDGYPCYVAIKGIVFDVNGKEPYLPGGSYSVFSGHDASRALAKTSTNATDVSPEWFDLDDKEKGVLNDWYTFFNITIHPAQTAAYQEHETAGYFAGWYSFMALPFTESTCYPPKLPDFNAMASAGASQSTPVRGYLVCSRLCLGPTVWADPGLLPDALEDLDAETLV